jgi:hypothetical protein
VCDSKGNQASSAGQHKTNLSWRQKADIFQCVLLDGWSGVAFIASSCDAAIIVCGNKKVTNNTVKLIEQHAELARTSRFRV